MREENTIYIRKRYVNGMQSAWQTFAKAKGHGFLLVIQGSREESILAAAQVLWAINKWGPEGYHAHQPLDAHPDSPKENTYPVIDEV